MTREEAIKKIESLHINDIQTRGVILIINEIYDEFEKKEESIKRQSFQPYVDETVEPCESYLVFCENHSPWDEEEKNMVRVHSNAESHKMLEILEKHFGIKNHHKRN